MAVGFVPDADGKRRAEAVIKLDIINRVAEKTGVPKMKAEQAVDALFQSMKEALTRGERIELRGFGVFVVKPRKRGVGRNPRTGEEVAIPSGKTIRFKPGKELQAHEEEAFAGFRPLPEGLNPSLREWGLHGSLFIVTIITTTIAGIMLAAPELPVADPRLSGP